MLKPILISLCLASAASAQFPQAEISNGAITAKLYLPDAGRGYYRATRFDWSGVIYSLRTKNHEYFGQWFERYDPKIHDAIQGPVEEFRSGEAALGYNEAQPGATFIRIGAGVLRRPDAAPFNSFKTYDIVDPGKWTVRTHKDRIEFIHELSDGAGTAYRYKKTVRLLKNKPEMVLEHALKNTGKKAIHTQQYNHNFFMMDAQPTGPDVSVKFPFELRATQPLRGGVAEARGREIAYLKEMQGGQYVYGEFAGFGADSSDYDFRLEHRKAKAGVRIRGSLPIVKLVYWSIRTTFCPEAYVNIDVEPGREAKWKYTYEFYDLP